MAKEFEMMLVIIILSEDAAQTPFTIDQTKILFPSPNPVTVAVLRFAEEIFPWPEKTVQVPIPLVGALPDKFATEPHTVKSIPALEFVLG